MLIAHLPSGYLLGRSVGARRAAMAAALIGSVAPDFDMLWFHLVDHGRVHHHAYVTHIPGCWLILAALVLGLLRWRAPSQIPIAAMFFAGVFLHLVLDTLVGGVMWLWPLDHRLVSLAVVPARHDHWITSFILHWSFLAELAICAAAIWLFRSDRRRRPATG